MKNCQVKSLNRKPQTSNFKLQTSDFRLQRIVDQSTILRLLLVPVLLPTLCQLRIVHSGFCSKDLFWGWLHDLLQKKGQYITTASTLENTFYGFVLSIVK